MAYDPQANRRRPRPDDNAPAPVDALLGERPPGSGRPPASANPVNDDPPPTPAVTPEPADPPSDQLLLTSGVATAIGALVAALTLRHLWLRHRSRNTAPDDED